MYSDNPEDTQPAYRSERGAYLKKVVRENKLLTLTMAAVCCWIPISIILDLNALESGSVTQVRVIQPVATIYQLLGYWPAALFLPVLMIAFAAFVMFKFIVRR